MSLKNDIIAGLPPFRGERVMIKKHQGTGDIITEILEAQNFFSADYDDIYDFFWTGDIYTTCQKLWDFEKYNLVYDAESGKDQSSKSPSAILQTDADCKHYSLFTGGVLAAIQRNENTNFDWFFRFANDTGYEYVTHVFVVVVNKNKEIWIDPCLTNFDQRKRYLITKDEHPMALFRISGVNDTATAKPKVVIVDKKKAFQSFLIFLAKNMFPETVGGVSLIKQLMRNYPDITNGPVKAYFVQQGFDWDMVQKFIYS